MNAKRLSKKKQREPDSRRNSRPIYEAAEARVDEAVESYGEEQQEAIATPTVAEAQEQPAKLYRVAFAVNGTLEEIKALKNFLVNGGYKYEQL